MKIGEKLKKGRIDINMTQEEVSNVLNVSRTTISSWEVNRTYPSLDMLVTLSDLYDISLDALLREDRKMVEEITKEVKNSKRRKKIIIAILLICIPVMFFLGYQLWRAGLVVSPNQINNTEIELNGDILNSKSEIMITLELGRFKKYSGYWIETNEAKNTLEVQLYQNYSLSDSQEETLTIPLDILESEELQQGINRITISGFTFFNTEELYTEY